MEAFGEADQGELGGGVGQHVGDGDLAADGGDVDDGGAAWPAGQGRLGAHVREGLPGGVERGEEVDLHGALEGFDGLRLDGADLDDAGVVDEEVDAAEAGDGLGDEAAALVGFGEVGGDEVEVFRLEVGVFGEKRGLGLLEFVELAGAEDELWGFSGEAAGDCEA